MGITQQGIDGEQMLFNFLKGKGIKFFQADAIGIINGKYTVFECKNQEMYKAPPFDGHGLPKWQVEARLKFQQETGIKCIFIVFDSGNVYYQWLNILNNTEYHDTNGAKPRRIYNLKYFNTQKC